MDHNFELLVEKNMKNIKLGTKQMLLQKYAHKKLILIFFPTEMGKSVDLHFILSIILEWKSKCEVHL